MSEIPSEFEGSSSYLSATGPLVLDRAWKR
jgi:hypothetical protein